jgi:predicted nuclease of predicted toxin-antitoxin system
MIILDVHLSLGLALWLTSTFNVECYSALCLNLQFEGDKEIFFRAWVRNAIVITKDDDFVSFLTRNGSPPKVFGCLRKQAE